MAIRWTRRELIAGATLAAAAGSGARLSALQSVTLGARAPEVSDTLVVLFLRGGADGLNMVAPYGDDDYYRLRPALGLPAPNDARSSAAARALYLDPRFGFHPRLAPLLPLFHNGQLAVIHAIGSGDQTRSHFEAMATMERGLSHDTGASGGWLARHLECTAISPQPPLRAVAIAETMPDSLRGASAATAVSSLNDFRLSPPVIGKRPQATRTSALTDSIREMYGPTAGGDDLLHSAGRETLRAMDAIARIDPNHYRPEFGAIYPKGDLGDGLRQAAALIKGDVGLEIACLDMGGWDTHVAQGREIGLHALRLAELGESLAAFARDLGPHFGHVTTLVMTEFGRRAAENSGFGTDHGRGGCMFLMGGGFVGGRVYGEWPGLGPDRLEGPGDLRVTTDYRRVLSEVLAARLRNPRADLVFPEYTPSAPVGLFRRLA